MIKESLLAYSFLLRIGLVSIEQYTKWLDDIFLRAKDESEILIALEFCSNDINKTVTLINNLINPNIDTLNYSLVGQIVFKAIEDRYHAEPCDLADLANKAYNIWSILPDNVRNEDPFFILCYIDDPLEYGNEKQTRELFQKLFDFYKT